MCDYTDIDPEDYDTPPRLEILDIREMVKLVVEADQGRRRRIVIRVIGECLLDWS